MMSRFPVMLLIMSLLLACGTNGGGDSDTQVGQDQRSDADLGDQDVSVPDGVLPDSQPPDGANPDQTDASDHLVPPDQNGSDVPVDVGEDTNNPCVPTGAEQCNGLDDDCDNSVDESACDDQNTCTTDTCVPATGCTHTPLTGPSCDDGDSCTGPDTCSSGVCVAGPPLELCSTGDPCRVGTCVDGQGCVATPISGVECNDGSKCSTDDMCLDGECTGNLVDCDDSNPCTVDTCNPDLGCLHVYDPLVCCPEGTEACQGECVDYASDWRHCSACGKPCDADQWCDNGTCSSVCPVAGEEVCNGVCTNKLFDALNCQECGHVCQPADHALGVCNGGVCSIACIEPFVNCDTALENGCEANLESDLDNCGDCDEICPASNNGVTTCVSGKCKIVDCDEWFEDCDGKLDNGCEADTLNDYPHCGGCGKYCDPLMGEACENGSCNCIPMCLGNECGSDHCGGSCGTCGLTFDLCLGGQCLCQPQCQNRECGPDACGGSCGSCAVGTTCTNGKCAAPNATSFLVLDTASAVSGGIQFLVLKVKTTSNQSQTANWCSEYQALCASVGGRPVGCGGDFLESLLYKNCATDYGSDGVNEVVGCNPSGGVAVLAQQAGFTDAIWENSFGFHTCSSDTCSKVLCDSPLCNVGISYLHYGMDHAYTACSLCTPDCTGKNCGGDGCGGLCGTCSGPQDECHDGVCTCMPECDGKTCGGDGCGGSCSECVGKECGNDGCDGNCGNCPGDQYQCLNNQCVCFPQCDGKECGSDACGGSCGSCGGSNYCWDGMCQATVGSFVVLDQDIITQAGLPYLVVKVAWSSTTSQSKNWCQEYTNLCAALGAKPTGCGPSFSTGAYLNCKTEYDSYAPTDTLGCNPAGGVRYLAQLTGHPDATDSNSFAFHSCDDASCSNTLCDKQWCNVALTYFDTKMDIAYTACIMQ